MCVYDGRVIVKGGGSTWAGQQTKKMYPSSVYTFSFFYIEEVYMYRRDCEWKHWWWWAQKGWRSQRHAISELVRARRTFNKEVAEPEVLITVFSFVLILRR